MEWDGARRNEIRKTALSVRTQDECDRAEALIVAWMKDYPRDFGMLNASEMVAMISERYDKPAGEARPPSSA